MDKFMEQCKPKVFYGDGYCYRCAATYYLSVAHVLIPEPMQKSLILNGYIPTNCPKCDSPFKVFPSIEKHPTAA